MSVPRSSLSEKPVGKLTLEELQRLIDSRDIETVIVAFPDAYGRLLGKRCHADFFAANVAEHGTHVCNYLLTVDMEMEPVPGYGVANWDRGYGDFHLRPDLSTLRKAAWLEKTALVLCDLLAEQTDSLIAEAPRSILRRQVQRASEQGFTALAGSEAEYYMFSTSYREASRVNYERLETAGWYNEDYHLLQGGRSESLNARARRCLTESGVPVECTKGEWGLGQHELNLRYSEILEMADRHAIYKHCLREIADSNEASVTFMAKFSADRAGSSCHLHLSLCDGERNLFGEREGGDGSNLFQWFLGGWMAHVEEMMVFYAPTVNSYKRFQAESWAPTSLSWSRDNRTAGFRVVGSGQSHRIECRLPGADVNPYLAYAAALASGLDGIANNINPPDELVGNAYAKEHMVELPRTLSAAIERLEKSEFAHEAFGCDVVSHYSHFYRTEQAAFDAAVTDWERKRYFERI